MKMRTFLLAASVLVAPALLGKSPVYAQELPETMTAVGGQALPSGYHPTHHRQNDDDDAGPRAPAASEDEGPARGPAGRGDMSHRPRHAEDDDLPGPDEGLKGEGSRTSAGRGADVQGSNNLGSNNPGSNTSGPNASQGHEDSRPAAPETAEERAMAQALSELTTDRKTIRRIKDAQFEQDEEVNAPYGPAARPVTRSLAVTLRPGEQPPVLHLRYGSVTAITFADLTGQPWNVTGVDGDTESYGLTKIDQKTKSNVITVFPKVHASRGRNLVVSLENGSMPVIFDLNTGGEPTVDYRVDVTVRQKGPNAKSDYVVDSINPTDDSIMQQFINDTPPDKAKMLKTSNSAVEAWRYESMMYLRTPLEVLSPGPLRRSVGNISGVHVYAMVDAPTVILSQDGRTTTVSIGR